METTVTMSLERYKELEAKENTLTEYFQSGIMHYFKSSMGEYLSNQQTIDLYIDQYNNILGRMDVVRSKIKEWSELKTKPNLYEYLSNSLYMPLK